MPDSKTVIKHEEKNGNVRTIIEYGRPWENSQPEECETDDAPDESSRPSTSSEVPPRQNTMNIIPADSDDENDVNLLDRQGRKPSKKRNVPRTRFHILPPPPPITSSREEKVSSDENDDEKLKGGIDEEKIVAMVLEALRSGKFPQIMGHPATVMGPNNLSVSTDGQQPQRMTWNGFSYGNKKGFAAESQYEHPPKPPPASADVSLQISYGKESQQAHVASTLYDGSLPLYSATTSDPLLESVLQQGESQTCEDVLFTPPPAYNPKLNVFGHFRERKANEDTPPPSYGTDSLNSLSDTMSEEQQLLNLALPESYQQQEERQCKSLSDSARHNKPTPAPRTAFARMSYDYYDWVSTFSDVEQKSRPVPSPRTSLSRCDNITMNKNSQITDSAFQVAASCKPTPYPRKSLNNILTGPTELKMESFYENILLQEVEPSPGHLHTTEEINNESGRLRKWRKINYSNLHLRSMPSPAPRMESYKSKSSDRNQGQGESRSIAAHTKTDADHNRMESISAGYRLCSDAYGDTSISSELSSQTESEYSLSASEYSSRQDSVLSHERSVFSPEVSRYIPPVVRARSVSSRGTLASPETVEEAASTVIAVSVSSRGTSGRADQVSDGRESD